MLAPDQSREDRVSAAARSGAQELSEFEPAPKELRERSAHYRTLADHTGDPRKQTEYRWIADVLSNEADALERCSKDVPGAA